MLGIKKKALVRCREGMDDEIIRSIPLFSEVSNHTFEKLKSIMHIHDFASKEQIFSETGEAEGVYFVLSGLVRITKSCSCGKEVILGFRKAGESVLAVPLFNKRKTVYGVTAQMSQRGTILFIPLSDLEEIVREEPEIAITIMQLSQSEMMEFATTARNLALFDKNKALYVALIKLAEEYGVPSEHGIEISIPLSHQDIAGIIATSREHVSRGLAELAHQNILETKRKGITLLDLSALCALAGTEGYE